MLPFNVKDYTQKKGPSRKTSCAQQSIANQIVMGSMPQQTSAPPLQQQPARQ